MKTLVNWISDIYKEHGYVAALVTIVVLVLLAVGVSWFAGIDLRDIARWVDVLGSNQAPFLGGFVIGCGLYQLTR